MKKVGVLGCCISRDAFNSKIVHNYKDFFKLKIDGERISLISIFQNPILVDEKSIEISPPTPVNKTCTKFISDDLNKNFIKDLLQKNIDYLVFDTLIEVPMGILYFNNQIMTHNVWDLPKTKFYNNMGDKFILNIYDYPEEFFCIWTRYCDLFFKFLKIYCPNVQVFLNKGRLIDKFIKSDKTTFINPEFSKKANLINPYLDKLDNYIEKNFDVHVIEFDYEHTFLKEDHLWGPAPQHYQYSFYYNLIDELKNFSHETKKYNFNDEDKNYFKKEVKRLNFETKLFLENIKKQSISNNLRIYNTGRVDIKNYGQADNKIKIIKCNMPISKNNFPEWFSTDEGKGLVISNYIGQIDLKIQCINDGILKIYLRGEDVHDKNGNRFPIYVDFINFKVNDKLIFENSKLVCHDTPYIFEKKVKNLEILHIYVEWLPFNPSSIYEK